MMQSNINQDDLMQNINKNNGNISQLSSALRHVNITNNNGTTDQAEIHFASSGREDVQQQQQGMQQPNMQQVHLDDMVHPVPVQQSEQEKQQQQQVQNMFTGDFNPSQYSRITQFFQNQPMEGFTLFSHRSAPNGYKVAMVLSELGLQYNTIFLDFGNGEHRAPEFVSVNPNARVPALIDHGLDNLGLWESGAILLHLVKKYYKETGEPLLWADNLSDQSQIDAWLFFQTSGHAPMIGQALHFRYFHSQKIPSAVERYTDEVRRVYGVLEVALAERREAFVMELDTENAASYSAGTTPISQSRFFDYPVWLVGDNITIADISFVPWNNVIDKIGINIKVEFPEVYKWTKHMMRRPAIVQALRGE